jgi:flagellar biogenesis protein FliO
MIILDDYTILIRVIISLCIIIAIIYSLRYFLRTQTKSPSSIKIIQVCHLDYKRRIMMIEQEEKKYLILLSPTGDILLDRISKPSQESL